MQKLETKFYMTDDNKVHCPYEKQQHSYLISYDQCSGTTGMILG